MPQSPHTLAAVAVVTAVLAAVFVSGVKRWALRNMMDVPNERSSHTTPTPRGGGVVIAVFALLLGIAMLLTPNRFELSEVIRAEAPWWIGGAFAIVLVSFVDDLRSIGTGARFLVHFAAAGALLIGCGGMPSVDLGVVVNLGVVGYVVAFIWIVGLINAYNFMDGIDGIAGSQAAVAGIAWAILGALGEEPFLIYTGVVIAASALGFLFHNWPPATIFMGDVGATFLGFAFAGFPLLGDHDPKLPVVALLFIWPFFLDTALTFTRRLIAGENVLKAHRSHFYQRLVISGLPHGVVSGGYGVCTAAIAACGIAWFTGVVAFTVPLVAALVFAVGVVTLTRARERSPASESR